MGKRLACVGLLVVIAACESESPRPTRQDVERQRALERRRGEESERQARARREAAERREGDEAEWPEPWPAIFIKGEPAPVRSKTEPPAGPSRPWQPRPGAFGQPAGDRPREGAGVGAEAAAFVRRLELLDATVVQVDRLFRESAEQVAQSFTRERLHVVRTRPEEARLRGFHEPTQSEIQAVYDQTLAEQRARWIREDRLRRDVDEKMKDLKR